MKPFFIALTNSDTWIHCIDLALPMLYNIIFPFFLFIRVFCFVLIRFIVIVITYDAFAFALVLTAIIFNDTYAIIIYFNVVACAISFYFQLIVMYD